MSSIPEIIKEINQENGSNYKISVLEKHSDNELLKRVLKMTYDKVAFTYGVTTPQILKFEPLEIDPRTLGEALFTLESLLSTRAVTGHSALQTASNLIGGLSDENADIFKKVINRDLRINVGRSNINKVFKGLIVKPPYMRCGIYGPKTTKKINWPACLQLKADGMYQAVEVEGEPAEITVSEGDVRFASRSGEKRELPHLKAEYSLLPEGVYMGELLVEGIADRALANGHINSDSSDKSLVYMQLWDFVSLDEYSRGKDKKNKSTYRVRFDALKKILRDANPQNIKLIPCITVNNLQEALAQVSEWMTAGYEGGILKDWDNIFCDHTSPTQLKLKLEIEADMRCVGFTEGKVGTKREGKVGAAVFENDEGIIKGRCSGMKDDILDDMTKHPEKYLNGIMVVQFNDLTQGRGNDYWALSHPRYMEMRTDKNDTDTHARVLELREMAMLMGAE